MKASDYIVEFFIKNDITDVFGYPGGMVTHLMDSFGKYPGEISAHSNYHEQGSAFCACGYAQVSGRCGMAYATSGPGATNLITGIANAYFDSIPTIYITGQVNTYEAKGGLSVRQKGFQETDIISLVSSITKYAVQILNENEICYHLEKALYLSTQGRPGPVLLDIPMDIQRKEIVLEQASHFVLPKQSTHTDVSQLLTQAINQSSRPCILVGSGIKSAHKIEQFREIAQKQSIPVVSSMPAFDVMLPNTRPYYGFIGAYGHRNANFLVAKADLIISIGSRLDGRQVSTQTENFAPHAKLIRFDIDEGELSNRIKSDEIQICCDISDALFSLKNTRIIKDFTPWIHVCDQIKEELQGVDTNFIQNIVEAMSDIFFDNAVITTDVGQNQVWIAQYFKNKPNQRVLFSSSHGAMGCSLPSAIGAYYAGKKPVLSVNGDGGFQMNLQELQFISREKLPIKIVIFNNNALGMIRHFQEMYFDCAYVQTTPTGGYTNPVFSKIASAYDMPYYCIKEKNDINRSMFEGLFPAIIEINLPFDTYVFPKLAMGKPPQDQDPLIDRQLYEHLMSL